jgi:long-chain fatty acid transport protein
MGNSERLAIRLGSAAIAAVAATSVAQAGAFAIREQSACGQGASFAGVAAGCNLSSMFWNPATLIDVEGLEIEKVSSGVFPTADVDLIAPLSRSEGDIVQDALVPAFYAAYRLNESLVFGVGVNSPYGLVTKYDAASPLRLGAAGTSRVFSINVNPAIAVQLNDWLALALGAQVQFVDVRLTAQALPPLPGTNKIEGDDVGVGLTAGIELTPIPGTQIGLGYRSRIDHELEGDLTTGIGVFDVTGEGFDLPDVVTFGVRQRITDAFHVLAGVEWSNWSRFETVTLTGAPAPIPLPFDYEDGRFFSLGGEYDVSPRVTLRAGVAYELSPIDDDTRTYRLPDSDRLWLSAGGTFRASERWSIDAGYTFISAQEADLLPATGGGPPGNGGFTGESEGHVHIISAAVKVRWGGAPAPLK